jgi:hypothetical protein
MEDAVKVWLSILIAYTGVVFMIGYYIGVHA